VVATTIDETAMTKIGIADPNNLRRLLRPTQPNSQRTTRNSHSNSKRPRLLLDSRMPTNDRTNIKQWLSLPV
jgi:hypothetical protein